MIATDELRKLLDERGVEHYDKAVGTSRSTEWGKNENYKAEAAYVEYADGCVLRIYDCTPEQAIAATLGGGECVPHGEWESIIQTQEVRHVFCECGYELGTDERDSFPFQRTRLFAMPNYCQECGRKIRKAVRR